MIVKTSSLHVLSEWPFVNEFLHYLPPKVNKSSRNLLWEMLSLSCIGEPQFIAEGVIQVREYSVFVNLKPHKAINSETQTLETVCKIKH